MRTPRGWASTFYGVPVRAVRTFRPRGDAGAVQTLKQLRDMVRRSAVVPSIVGVARAITAPALARDKGAHIRLVREWLVERVKWRPDPEGAEYLVPPPVLLKRIAEVGQALGDCDDVAALAATLLRAVGIKTRLTAVAFEPSRALRHVLAEGHDGRAWVELDTTRPAQTAARPSRALTLGV